MVRIPQAFFSEQNITPALFFLNIPAILAECSETFQSKAPRLSTMQRGTLVTGSALLKQFNNVV